MEQKFAVNLAMFIPFAVEDANCPKYFAVRPSDRQTEVGDHPKFNIRVRFPFVILESVRDKQHLASCHHGLAIGTATKRCDLISFPRVLLGLAGDENSDVWGLYFHNEGGRNVHDFANQVYHLLPLPDDMRGYLDRMCHGPILLANNIRPHWIMFVAVAGDAFVLSCGDITARACLETVAAKSVV
jgi:hypothetical protein